MTTATQKADLNDIVTKHMHRQFTTLPRAQTVGQALTHLRTHPPENRIIYLYVVDADNRLEGVVPTRRLILSDPERPLADIMVRKVITLPDQATVLDACEFFLQYRFLALPVVDADKKLLGQVDVDLYTEELVQFGDARKKDELFQLIGVQMTEAMQNSAWAAFRSRIPWLCCNLGAGILAAFLAGIYQDVLSWNHAVLALFLPVVLALAESVSIQSVSVALQTLSGRKPTWPILIEKLTRELGTGLLLGVTVGLAVGLIALAWLGDPIVLVCLLGGIGAGVTCAALIGLSVPFLLHMLQRDPRLAAGPIALAAADMITLFFYFNLGLALMR